jgi:hypothetical protein
MRDKSEVLEKFREMSGRYLAERKEQYLSRKPINCGHNVRLRVKGKGHIGFCKNPSVLAKCGTHKMFICNEDDTAHRCLFFECKSTDELVEQNFKEILLSPSRCGNDYPKLAMLIWFLQEFETSSRMSRLKRLLQKGFDSVLDIMTFRWWR